MNVVLHKHKIYGNSRREDVVNAIYANFTADQLEELFPIKYYDLTELGKQELQDNSYICLYRSKGPLTIWELNRLAYAFPDDDMEKIVEEYEQYPNRVKRRLNAKERELGWR